MPQFQVTTPDRTYPVVVERGIIDRLAEFLPPGHGRIFVVSTNDVWRLYGARVAAALDKREFEPLFFAGGEDNKRLAPIEQLAERMVERGADRTSLIVAVGGGIVTDMAGFLAAIFMRGIPVVQVPTTLLAQVDAAVGGKTGVNLVAGKNLVGSFHQPLAVLIDPSVLASLPPREYRAGLYEIIKSGVIVNAPLFRTLADRRDEVLAQTPEVVDHIIAESVRIKAEVVSADERESGLRRILNFGHTFGHALEAETRYTRFLHGEAVSWGMRAATYLAADMDIIPRTDSATIIDVLDGYGPIPACDHVGRTELQVRLLRDKKTIQNRIHFVLPVKIGEVVVRSDVSIAAVQHAIDHALADCRAAAA
ncbi:MAG TPA: 3-dehydroquinate synthase [Bryobacteraceae bacterium]|jgi:3-dehydroquinate synthase|nr:3-dehydroquinate synthase [Bryobacteraceae bacterium]